MARRVFFSFHYDRDIWRVSQVRNSWVTKGNGETAGFWDAAAWESVKRGGDTAIKRWIEDQLSGTSVTVVLIGAETAGRKYVLHEIQRSLELGKGLLGIRIHGLRDRNGYSDSPGRNPFDGVQVMDPHGRYVRLANHVSLYDYVSDKGYENMDDWIEGAAQSAGR